MNNSLVILITYMNDSLVILITYICGVLLILGILCFFKYCVEKSITNKEEVK